jgi:hypothetical protein
MYSAGGSEWSADKRFERRPASDKEHSVRSLAEEERSLIVDPPLADLPTGRPTETRPSPEARVVGLPRVGGLDHRYVWREAA